MLSAILSTLGSQFIGAFFDDALKAFTAYQNKQISEAQLREQLLAAMLSASTQIETAYADALAKTYDSFMQALGKSKLMQYVWGFVTISQALMLLWFQIGIPLIIAVGLVQRWPSSGDTAQWAYLLVAACLGMGPIVMRSGPGAGSLLERMKSAIK